MFVNMFQITRLSPRLPQSEDISKVMSVVGLGGLFSLLATNNLNLKHEDHE